MYGQNKKDGVQALEDAKKKRATELHWVKMHRIDPECTVFFDVDEVVGKGWCQDQQDMREEIVTLNEQL